MADRSLPPTDHVVVLNVDDYEAGRYATTRVLQQAGYEVREAASGAEALEMVRERPDLVVLDVNLPDLSGFEVCEQIKADPATADVPVLYLSAAYRGAEYRVQGLELGADGYLTQPVDPRELVATVHALLRAREVKAAMERSELRFRCLMTATTDIIWTTDPSGALCGGQDDWSDFTGQTEAEYLAWGWLRAVHPAERAAVERGWRAAVERGERYEIECRIRRRDGEYRWLQGRAVPVRERDGTLREWVGAYTDVSDERRASEELRENMARLELLSEAGSRLLLTDDPREYVDHLFRRLSAYLELEVYLNYLLSADGSLLELHAWSGIDAAVAESVRQLDLGEAVCGHVARRREEMVAERVQSSRDPRLELVRSLGLSAYACFPLLSHERLIGTLSFGTRTRERFTPDELSLMQLVCSQVAVAVERARLISALRERARALEDANRAKADFLATMSHELRTPLNAMIGYADLLLLGVPDPIPDGARAQVERIRGAATHLTQLIEEVLTHARIEAGRDELHLENTDLPALVAEVVALVRPLAGQKALRFAVEDAHAPGRIDTDARKLRQILLNLLSNAVKFTERGEVRLVVHAAGEELLLEVHDTGIGIAPAHLERVFEPFWQVDGSRTRRVGGTGLGLGVVRQLAERLGGSAHARSEEGRGSTFVVRLPLRIPRQAVPA